MIDHRHHWTQLRRNWGIISFVLVLVFGAGGAWSFTQEDYVEQVQLDQHIEAEGKMMDQRFEAQNALIDEKFKNTDEKIEHLDEHLEDIKDLIQDR